MTQAWLQQRERSNDPALRFLVRMSLALGRPAGRALLYPVCLYFVLFSVKARDASRKYLSRVLDRPPRFADLFRHYYSFATVALDRMFLLRNRFAQFDVRVHGTDILEEAKARGEPCFLLGAHCGSFEALHVFGEERNINVTMMMFEHGSRNMNALARAIKPDLDKSVIGMGSLDSMIRVWTLGMGIGFGRYPFSPGVWEGGHTIVTLDEKETYCGCGGRGHLEGVMGHRSMRLRFLDMEPEEVFEGAKKGEARCVEFKKLYHRALAAATASSVHMAGPGKFFLTGPYVGFVDLPMLRDYAQQMVKMSPLQGYSLEIVEEEPETRVIGSAVSAEQAAGL